MQILIFTGLLTCHEWENASLSAAWHYHALVVSSWCKTYLLLHIHTHNSIRLSIFLAEMMPRGDKPYSIIRQSVCSSIDFLFSQEFSGAKWGKKRDQGDCRQ